LGSGSYGAVYSCFFEEVVTAKVHKFALKTIQIPSSIQEVKKIEDTVATTRQEVRALIRLRQNPNIIKIEDVIGDRDHRRIYIVLEYCNSKDLESFFEEQRAEGRLRTEDEVLYYFKQLLNAFQDLYK
jgi:serine/threonine protein kinase